MQKSDSKNLRVCYFGDYDRAYNRNHVLIEGLKRNGVAVDECNERASGLMKYIRLARSLWRKRGLYDVLVVGFSGSRGMVPLARGLSRKPVVWDAFYSQYDSVVFDRKLASRWSPKALYYWLADLINCKLAGTILLDTNQHINYFVETFGVSEEKCHRLFIGADDEMFRP